MLRRKSFKVTGTGLLAALLEGCGPLKNIIANATYLPKQKLDHSLSLDFKRNPKLQKMDNPVLQDPSEYGLEGMSATELPVGKKDKMVVWSPAEFDPSKKNLVIFPGNYGHLGEAYKTDKGEYYIEMIKEAARDYNVVAVEYPGYGTTEKTHIDERKLYASAEKAMDWLVKEQSQVPSKMHLLGVSMGGPIAAHAARYLTQSNPFQASNTSSVALTMVSSTLSSKDVLEDMGKANSPIAGLVDKLDTGVELENIKKVTQADQRIHLTYVQGGADELTPGDQVTKHENAAQGLNFIRTQTLEGEQHYIDSAKVLEAVRQVETARSKARPGPSTEKH